MLLLGSLYKAFWDDGSYFGYNQSEWAEKNVVLMQFTGLHDKNGKEIYEDDIILHGMLCQRWKIGFKEGSFLAQIVDEDYEEDLKYLGIGLEGNGTEVIGNVWENPELLT